MVNYIVGSRGCGKTRLISYLIARQFMLPNQNIVCIFPQLKNAKAMWAYLESMLEFYPHAKFDSSENVISNEDIDPKTGRSMKTSITFVSGRGKSGMRGMSANLLIFDEMAYMDEDVVVSSLPLATRNDGLVFGISTPDINNPNNFFYMRLLNAELEHFNKNSKYYARRVTIYDSWFPAERIAMIRADEETNNPKAFRIEYMCEFFDTTFFQVDKMWIFDSEPVIKNFGQWKTERRYTIFSEHMDNEPREFDNYIISYDIAKKADRSGVVCIGVNYGEPGEVLMANYMPKGVDIMVQIEWIVELINWLGRDKCVFAFDY